jgi:hypothetical membrane protein
MTYSTSAVASPGLPRSNAVPASSLTSLVAARLAIGAAAAVVGLLASLHVLSPEFDPAWRVISEYANGRYSWVLSLMFVAGAVYSWSLAFALRAEVRTRAGTIGLICLVTSGIGSAMASVFAINHPLHYLAGILGVFSFPFGAMLISISLGRTVHWSTARTALLWTANLTWISTVLMYALLVVMIVTYIQAGGEMTSNSAEVTALPAGTIALVGYAGRLEVVLNCVWAVTVAWYAITLRFKTREGK